jgi:hypothetical protein
VLPFVDVKAAQPKICSGLGTWKASYSPFQISA